MKIDITIPLGRIKNPDDDPFEFLGILSQFLNKNLEGYQLTVAIDRNETPNE